MKRSLRLNPRVDGAPIGGSEMHAVAAAGAGFLLAYDDPVGLARELISFCG